MKKLELIKQKCIEANPEIIALKDGCYVLCKNNRDEYSNFFCGNVFGDMLVDKHNSIIRDLEIVKNNPDFKIIGRPITIADVLMAIQSGSTNKHYIFVKTGGTQGLMELIILWNLKETLENQSEEIIDFLYNLLK